MDMLLANWNAQILSQSRLKTKIAIFPFSEKNGDFY